MPDLTLNIPDEFNLKLFLDNWTPISDHDDKEVYFKQKFYNVLFGDNQIEDVFSKKQFYRETILSIENLFKEENKCSFDYELVYDKYSSGRKKGFREESENLCFKTKTDIELMLRLKDTESENHNKPKKLIIRYDCSNKAVDLGILKDKNNDLYDILYSLKESNNIDIEPTEISLTLDDYYKFITTLFVLDPYHDFRSGFRNKKKCTKYCKSKNETKFLKDKVKACLTYMKDRLYNEYKFLNKNNTSDIDNFFELFEKSESDYESSILTHFARDNISTDSLLTYKNTKDITDMLKASSSYKLKYISNNAIGINNSELYNMKLKNSFTFEVVGKKRNSPTNLDENDNESIEISFGGTISNSCKSLPATLYDGCDSGHCGNLRSNLDNGSGLEIGCYHIKFKFDETNYTEIISRLFEDDGNKKINKILQTENKIVQTIFIIRSVLIPKETKKSYIASFRFPIISKEKFIRENVTVDDELEYAFNTDIFPTTNNISFGTLLRKKSKKDSSSVYQYKEVDVIHTSRKALCDFGQYLNGMLKTGGYYGKIVQNKNTVTPAGYFPTADETYSISPSDTIPTISDYITVNTIKNNNYPFLAMHGDQPAAALNMFLLYVIPSNFVNNFSHMVYGNKDGFVFANYQGRITQVPVSNKKSNKMYSGGSGQDGDENECMLNKMYNILFEFFELCISFEMEQSHINTYNIFYNNHLKDKSEEYILNSLKKNTDFKNMYDEIKNSVLSSGKYSISSTSTGEGTGSPLIMNSVRLLPKTTRESSGSETDDNAPPTRVPPPTSGSLPGPINFDKKVGGSKNKTRKMNKKQKKNRKTKSKRRYIRKTSKRFTKFKSSSSSNKKTRKV